MPKHSIFVVGRVSVNRVKLRTDIPFKSTRNLTEQDSDLITNSLRLRPLRPLATREASSSFLSAGARMRRPSC